MPAPSTATDFLQLVRKSGIHTAEALERLLADAPALPDEPTQCAAALVRLGVLTPFQAKLLLTGKYRGFRLGPYVIREQIGQGGMGAVYAADHETLRRRVAIKVLTGTDGADTVAVERFLREARAAAALDHPNIVRIFDVGKQGAVHYLVMEYVDGQTLDKVVAAGGPIACGRAVEYVTQAAAGLQHAYEKGFVHRDIKPANLILARDGTVKILDMGLARSFDAGDNLTAVLDKGAVVGTADYISPEQAMNSPDLDTRADIYSLGATFFTLVAGRPPFEGTTTQKLLQHQMKSAPSLTALDKTFPPGLAAVIARMMAKRPGDRFQTPAEVIAALAPWLPGSQKVVEALSRTNLTRAPELRDTLSNVIGVGTKPLTNQRLPAVLRRRWPLVAVGGAVLVVGFVLAVAALAGAFSSPKTRPEPGPVAAAPAPQPEPDHAQRQEQKGPVPSPRVEPLPPLPPPNPSPSVTPAAPAPKLEGLVYDLDLSGRRKFAERGRVLGDPAKPTVKWVILGRTGDGPFPPEWQGSALAQDAEYHAFVEDKDGPALGVKSAGSAAASLLAPTMPFPASKAKLRVRYLTDAAAGQFAVRFRPTLPRPGEPWEAGRLPATGGEWADKELDFDLKGATAGRFELVAGSDPKAGLWVKGFTAQEPTPLAERTLYKLDLSHQQPFVQRTVRFQKPGSSVPLDVVSESGTGKLPPSWYRWLEYPDTVAEFFADGPPGQAAVGMRNVSGTPGVMLTTPEFQARSGRCRLRVLYQTGPASPGFVVRFRPRKPEARATWDAGTLPATGGSWRLAVLDLDLKGSTAGLFELSNGAPGPDAALRLREFLVTDPH